MGPGVLVEKKSNNDYVDDSLGMGRLGYPILSKNFLVCIFQTIHASFTMGYLQLVLCQLDSYQSIIPKPSFSFRILGMRA